MRAYLSLVAIILSAVMGVCMMGLSFYVRSAMVRMDRLGTLHEQYMALSSQFELHRMHSHSKSVHGVLQDYSYSIGNSELVIKTYEAL